MKINDIMTKEVVYAEVPGSAIEALERMLEKDVSGMPVVKRGTQELVGVVTRNDFSRRPAETQLALLMTRDVATISPDADIKDAVEIFLKKNFRRLPVVDSGLVGMVTISDLVWRAIAKMKTDDAIEKYMKEDINVLWEETPAKIAFEIMRLSGARALPILSSDIKLVGVVGDVDVLKISQRIESTKKSESSGGTEGDKWGWDSKNVIYITTKKLEIPDTPVKDVMIKNVVTATKKTSISQCAKRMAKAKVEQVPIVNSEGKIIGIVRDVDLIRALV
ncbi:MAG: CBS domain-containing protein [Candidatus Hydrothermarchaeaceae archaeon]